MDPSQSPTQFNDDRDYPEYQAYFQSPSEAVVEQTEVGSSSPAQHVATDSNPVDNEPFTLRDDDAGAVNFGSMSPPIPTYELSPVKSRDDSTSGPGTSFPGGPPETPAPPHNPFANMQSKSMILHTSQIFQATQTTSAAKPFFNMSPTSSRPSPDLRAPNTISPNIGLFNNTPVGTSSPLKGRNMPGSPQVASSPPPATSPAPIIFSALLPGTDSRPCSRDDAPVDEPVVPESPIGRRLPPPMPRRRFLENTDFLQPQQMPSTDNEEEDPNPTVDSVAVSSTKHFEVDDDLGDDTIALVERRRLAAKSKRETAGRALRNINFSRSTPSFSQPSRKRKSANTTTDYITRRHSHNGDGDLTTSGEEAPPKTGPGVLVEDSQNNSRKKAKKSSSPSSVARLDDQYCVDGNNNDDDDNSHNNNKPIRNTSFMMQRDSSDLRSSEIVPETSPMVRPIPNIIGRGSGATASQGVSIPDLSAAESFPPQSTVAESGTGEEDVDLSSTKELHAGISSLPAAHTTEVNPPPSSDVPLARPARSKRNVLKSKNRLSETQRGQVGPIKVNIPPTTKEPHGLLNDAHTPSPSISNSSLTEFSQTPEVYAKVTPSTQDRPSSAALKMGRTHGSLSIEKNAPSLNQESPLPPYSSAPRQTRRARKLAVIQTDSTDELARSTPPMVALPSSPPFLNTGRDRVEKVMQTSVASRNARQRKSLLNTRSSLESIRQSSVVRDTDQLFQGMAFAISFQSRRPGESERKCQQRNKESERVSNSIISYGGHILATGFDELFEVPSFKALASQTSTPASTPTKSLQQNSLKLKYTSRSYGFAALIADGHSRKVKYMQALALGLPCISDRWIAMCIKKGEVVPWETYLLCAGNSSILGDAIRSRHLSPYSALESKFFTVIKGRTRLLDGQSILLVVKKSQRKEEQKKAYVFLAQVLGATLTRAETVFEARSKIKERESLNDPYDWVYYEGDEVGEALFGDCATVKPVRSKHAKGGKKRKRQNMAKTDAYGDGEGLMEEGTPPKRVKALSDEIVVQSLILGRLVEDDEMDLCKAP